MSIGLYDIDSATYTHVVFNLELMKLSTYYKKKKEVVVLAPVFEPERYSTFIIRKDYNDGIFDKKIFEPNVQYGGHAFSGGNYISLPEDIELSIPDKQLYLKVQEKFCDNTNHKLVFKSMMNFEHARISLDGKTVWDKADKPFEITNQTRGIIFHDYDLNLVEDGFEKVKEIFSRLNNKISSGCLIGMKFPIQLYTAADYEKWITFNNSANLYSMCYNGFMENEMFYDYISRAGESMLKQLEYNITYGCRDDKDFLENRLPLIYKQCLLAMSNNKDLRLVYDEDFFFDKRIERLILLINHYVNSRRHYVSKLKKRNYVDQGNKFTLYKYITSPRIYMFETFPFKKEEIRELFLLAREKSYETFKMFYELAGVQLVGGEINERIRN